MLSSVGRNEFGLYMASSLSFYGATGADLVVSGDRVKLLSGKQPIPEAELEWDALILFVWPSGKRCIASLAYHPFPPSFSLQFEEDAAVGSVH
jgi:hypothetical protein